MQKKITKTEKFQARFDEHTRFALNLLAKQQGKKYVTIIEDAIQSLAKEMCQRELGQPLSVLFHPHEGVRTLNLLALPSYRKSPDEEELRIFVLAHKEFFYADDKGKVPNLGLVMTLWDQIEHYRELWREKRHENYWVAAEAMEAHLKKVKIKPPKYGQGK